MIYEYSDHDIADHCHVPVDLSPYFLQSGLHAWLWWSRYACLLAGLLVYMWEWFHYCDYGSPDRPLLLIVYWGKSGVCVGTTREDPGMSMGFSRQHEGLCVEGQLRRILGFPRDPPDSMEGLCVWGKVGRILGCPRDPPHSMEGCVCGDN